MPRTTAAERKRQEAEERDRAVHAALAWPAEPCPQPYSKDEIDRQAGAAPRGFARAWTYNEHSGRVMRGCFSWRSHGRESLITTSQTSGGPWFATEAEARLALRWDVCREMAETLRRLVEAEAKAIVREGAPATA